MSTCPGKDIHCLYADNELQEPFKTEFEKHTEGCPHCRKVLEHYLFLRKALESDAASSDLSDSRLAEGYLRLKAQLSYKTVVMPDKPFSALSFSVKLVPAAAVLALAVALPLRFFGKTAQSSYPAAVSTAAVRAEPIRNGGVFSSETLPASSLASAPGTDYTVNIDMPKLTAMDVFKPQLSSSNESAMQIPLTGVSHIPFAQNVDIKLPSYGAEGSFK